MKLIKISLAIVLAFSFASCTTQNTTTKDIVEEKNEMKKPSEIKDQYWKLTELAGKPVVQKGKEPFLQLATEGSRFSANGGCNNLMGSYTVDENTNRIKFSATASTQMMCEDMETEKELKRVLETVDNYTIANGVLSLNKARMMPLAKFVLVDKNSAAAQLNGNWELDYISPTYGADINTSFPKQKPSINFDTNAKRVSGFGGCNRFNGGVDIKGYNLKFGAMMTTNMACNGVKEDSFFKTLNTVSKFSVDSRGDILNLIAGDIAVMRFKKIK